MDRDLYAEFLHLPPGPRPPNHYEILALPLFEPDRQVIHAAVLRQTKELKRWALHPDWAIMLRVQEMLNEVNRAGFILEDPKTKAPYDRELAERLGVPLPHLEPPPAGPVPLLVRGPGGEAPASPPLPPSPSPVAERRGRAAEERRDRAARPATPWSPALITALAAGVPLLAAALFWVGFFVGRSTPPAPEAATGPLRATTAQPAQPDATPPRKATEAPVVKKAESPLPPPEPARVQVYVQWPFDEKEAKRRQQETARALGIPVEETLDLGRGVKMTFVLIPAGEFMMGDTLTPEEVNRRWPVPGTDPSWFRNAHPRHLVRLSRPFYLGKTEVTRGQFDEFVRDAAYRTDRERAGGGNTWSSSGFEQTDEHPVVFANWDDATAFCRWLSGKAGKRLSLPTEAQWEYACRAGSDGTWPWGDREADAQGRANISGEETTLTWRFRGVGDGFRATAPVATFAPNVFGLHDVIGSAWEWCADWFGETYYQDSPRDDPQGPDAGEFRVFRGGSWVDGPGFTRAAVRGRLAPTTANGNNGFRASWTLK